MWPAVVACCCGKAPIEGEISPVITPSIKSVLEIMHRFQWICLGLTKTMTVWFIATISSTGSSLSCCLFLDGCTRRTIVNYDNKLIPLYFFHYMDDGTPMLVGTWRGGHSVNVVVSTEWQLRLLLLDRLCIVARRVVQGSQSKPRHQDVSFDRQRGTQ